MKILIIQNGRTRHFSEDTPILFIDFLEKHHIYVPFPCGGNGTCSKCRVLFEEAKGASNPTEKEKKLLSEQELEEGVRLACSCMISGDAVIQLPDAEDSMEILTGSSLNESIQTSGQEGYGIACDIGTTTIAMELVELSSGNTIRSASSVNHQREYGSDVISRIAFAGESEENAKILQRLIRQDLAALIGQFQEYDIHRMMIACNVTMAHLLMGYSVKKMGVYPFRPVTLDEIQTKICGIDTRIFPGMQAFVGGDITAGVYALDLDRKEETSLLVDLGTNGEMVLKTPKGLYASSVAAGPAFEGGKISCGMASVNGAIRSVMILGSLVRCKVIGNTAAGGMCGSGILEAVYELLRTGNIDKNGTLAPEYRDMGFPFAEGVYLTQDDIRQVQLAKASIRAGIECILERAGIERVDHIYLAGGFGFSLDVNKACRIGIFPEKLKKIIVPSGNTALLGAKKYLLHPEDRRQIAELASDVNLLSLADSDAFHEAYVRYINF